MKTNAKQNPVVLAAYRKDGTVDIVGCLCGNTIKPKDVEEKRCFFGFKDLDGFCKWVDYLQSCAELWQNEQKTSL